MKILMLVGTALGSVLLLGWLGLRMTPAPLPPMAPTASTGPETRAMPLPDDLPAPVERFYRELYGEQVPVVESAVVTGRGTMRVGGVTLPVRYRFTHDAGHGYRHHIEATVFTRRLLTVHETFLDGTARMELPVGVSEGPAVDQGANLALWAEAVWMPSVWLSDPRVRWEAVDEDSALLVVPFGDDEETFVVRFDPDTGLLRLLESMRFKDAADQARTLWLNAVLVWGELDGRLLPLETELTWLDDGSPWAHLTTEEVRYDVEVAEHLRRRGP